MHICGRLEGFVRGKSKMIDEDFIHETCCANYIPTLEMLWLGGFTAKSRRIIILKNPTLWLERLA